MRLMPLRWVPAIAALLFASAAQCVPIYNGTVTLSDGDATQAGRLFRGGVAQTWTNDEPFLGVTNASTSYHYQTVTLDLDSLMAGMTFGQYLQISVDYGSGGNEFVSAYLDGYSAGAMDLGWLGDTGSSGNAFGTNPRFFQVIVGSGHDLVLVINDTLAGLGFTPVNLLVEAFMTTDFDDPTPLPVSTDVPEPASLALVGIALAVMSRVRRRSGAPVA